MSEYTRPRLALPPVPSGADCAPEVLAYLRELHAALEQFAEAVHKDVRQGRSSLRSFDGAPTAADLSEGQVGIRADAGNEALCVNVAGTVKTASLA